MIISYKQLQTFFDQKLPSPDALSESLTFHAFEIESLEKNGKDTIIDIKILPNRAHDCLSYRGIAREVSSILEIPMKRRTSSKFPKPQKGSPTISVAIKDKRANRYMGVVINGVQVKKSPEWLSTYLQSIGQRSINNIVDATNYVMFQLGQPLHAFDYAKLSGKCIIVRPGKDGEVLTTLDGKDVSLNKEIMIIADEVSPLAIAGIKGGMKAEVDLHTTSIMLESANFDSRSIRITAQKLNIKTDASKRFESGLTPYLTEEALRDVAETICRIANTPATQVGAVVDVFPKKPKEDSIKVTANQLNRILGTYFSAREIESVWKKLGFVVSKKKSGDDMEWTIRIPVERLDLRIKEDIAEEVGRIMGYHKLVPTYPVEPTIAPKENIEWKVRDKMREVLIGSGFSEVYTYAFIGLGEIELANPLANDKKYLRNNLMNGLKQAVAENLKRETEIRIFEFGHIFGKVKGQISEEDSFAMLMGFQKRKEIDIKKDFYYMKGVLEEMLKALGVKNVRFEEAGGEHVAVVYSKDALLGFMSINGLELDMKMLIESSNERIVYTVPSRYPSIIRDVSLFVPLNTRSGDVQSVIDKNAGSLAKSVSLIDVFEQPEQGRKSFAFRLILQSEERTLEDAEANAVYDHVVDALRSANTDWVLRV